MPTRAKEYTEVELDQIRADAAEQARRAAAERCMEIIYNVKAPLLVRACFAIQIREEFSL